MKKKPVALSVDSNNIHDATVAGFGDEWSRFNQDQLSLANREIIFQDYFNIFPWKTLPNNAIGADIGCGSGRWAQAVAPKVGYLHLVDASSKALAVAIKNLEGADNVQFHHASVASLPLEDNSLDFAYSLGVLHHVPDTTEAVRAIACKLKSGAPLLLYLYYAFDNRSVAYRALWKSSDLIRRVVSQLPNSLRYLVSQFLASIIYWPLARVAWLLDRIHLLPSAWPLAYYRDKQFYVMRTDALDRFGTQLEQRFSRSEITVMLKNAGFQDINFSEHAPFWCVVAIRK